MTHSSYHTLTATMRVEREQRTEALRMLREQTRDQLQAQRTAFTNASQEQRKRLHMYRAQLAQQVSEQCANLAHAREHMARTQLLRLSGGRSELQADVAATLADYGNLRQEQALALRQWLKQQVYALHQDVQQTLAAAATTRFALVAHPTPALQPVLPTEVELLQAIQPTADQTLTHAGTNAYAQLVRVSIIKALEAQSGALDSNAYRQINASFKGLQANVDALRNEVAQRRTGMSESQRNQAIAHIDALAKTCQALRSDLDALAGGANDTYIATLRNDINAILNTIAAARETLQGPRPAPRRHGDDIRDDLTAIRGIGKHIEQRLNQAGIFTFIQIALSSSAELRSALGGARVANLDDWIAQARILAGMPG
jgi:predicted flap endonuclease-1-like 5' DNA nuclease